MHLWQNGSILPRESGVSQKPMKGAIAFEAPESMEVEMELPHRGKIKGMGIPEGITLIVGGGYHGKSTLLKALEQGIYNHVAGDGREYVITSDTAMKIRAEDGRCVSHINISPFINDLPNKKDTVNFPQRMPVVRLRRLQMCRSGTVRCKMSFDR